LARAETRPHPAVHDGRFEDYKAVISHYNGVLRLNLSPQETADLVEYLKSL
jgi:hypothetical protein